MTRSFRLCLVGGLTGLLCVLHAARTEATPKPGNVPPTLELQILDPNADPVGNPTAVPRQVAPGLALIDIPPTVIVHRFYYTGDRTFQGPFLKGGSCTLVVSHPRNGERVYIPVQMFPGAPRITYRCSSIEYDFGGQGVIVSFGLLCHTPKVEYRNGPSFARTLQEHSDKTHATANSLFERTGLPELGRKSMAVTKNVALTTIDRTHDLGRMIAAPVVNASQFIPGINLLQSTPEDQAIRERDRQIQRAASQVDASKANVFINTNR